MSADLSSCSRTASPARRGEEVYHLTWKTAQGRDAHIALYPEPRAPSRLYRRMCSCFAAGSTELSFSRPCPRSLRWYVRPLQARALFSASTFPFSPSARGSFISALWHPLAQSLHHDARFHGVAWSRSLSVIVLARLYRGREGFGLIDNGRGARRVAPFLFHVHARGYSDSSASYCGNTACLRRGTPA